jgi:hypothetical protein
MFGNSKDAMRVRVQIEIASAFNRATGRVASLSTEEEK